MVCLLRLFAAVAVPISLFANMVSSLGRRRRITRLIQPTEGEGAIAAKLVIDLPALVALAAVAQSTKAGELQL